MSYFTQTIDQGPITNFIQQNSFCCHFVLKVHCFLNLAVGTHPFHDRRQGYVIGLISPLENYAEYGKSKTHLTQMAVTIDPDTQSDYRRSNSFQRHLFQKTDSSRAMFHLHYRP
ncbi:hypothetical protein KIW84_010799 [Lathyrus oleraceus]|uniref:Uncharacterized protein n=1 Tax=Pisum sativum TaxID=3888 RepID=A0A9D4YKW9_PEA|nr:hypothetical protein KIW84_010799 [Pisum sativum]